MSEPKKRVRSSKRRDQNYRSALSQIVSHFGRGVKAHQPLHTLYEQCHEIKERADVTTSNREALWHALWALREYAVRHHSRWQLYLDGEPLTFDQISARANAEEKANAHKGYGPANDARLAVMNRICGRHEWDDSHDPFYEDEPAHLLNERTNERKQDETAPEGAAV